MLGNGDSKDTRVPIAMDFRTSGESETKVKKKCDSAEDYKEKIQRAMIQGDKRRCP